MRVFDEPAVHLNPYAMHSARKETEIMKKVTPLIIAVSTLLPLISFAQQVINIDPGPVATAPASGPGFMTIVLDPGPVSMFIWLGLVFWAIASLPLGVIGFNVPFAVECHPSVWPFTASSLPGFFVYTGFSAPGFRQFEMKIKQIFRLSLWDNHGINIPQ